jgi:glycolate oxidase iron-sulfur subunit
MDPVRDHGAGAAALADEEERLLACVHCGFCLTACPTYRVLGEENDSPRGRIHLMRALAEGRMEDLDAFTTHTDRCLGCRACETACPAGVEYGALLEAAREDRRDRGAAAGGPAETLLWLFRSPRLTRVFLAAGRWLRDLGLAGFLARILPGRAGLALGLLAATRPGGRGAAPRDRRAAGGEVETGSGAESAVGVETEAGTEAGTEPGAEDTREYVLLEGCVMSGLFAHVHAATRRTLAATGHRERAVPGQVCCGALHAHAGDRETARRLARRNLDAFEAHPDAAVVANSAGCGAALREYPHWFRGDPVEVARARRLSERVRDVSELLAGPPRPRAAVLEGRAGYDAPCHLCHGQGVWTAPLEMFRRVEGLDVRPLPSARECCGGAGVYNLQQPELASDVLAPKLREIREGGYDWLLTGNPGCAMQIGSGMAGASTTSGGRGTDGGDGSSGDGRPMVSVLHPVELLDRAFRASGLYDSEEREPQEG